MRLAKAVKSATLEGSSDLWLVVAYTSVSLIRPYAQRAIMALLDLSPLVRSICLHHAIFQISPLCTGVCYEQQLSTLVVLNSASEGRCVMLCLLIQCHYAAVRRCFPQCWLYNFRVACCCCGCCCGYIWLNVAQSMRSVPTIF